MFEYGPQLTREHHGIFKRWSLDKGSGRLGTGLEASLYNSATIPVRSWLSEDRYNDALSSPS